MSALPGAKNCLPGAGRGPSFDDAMRCELGPRTKSGATVNFWSVSL